MSRVRVPGGALKSIGSAKDGVDAFLSKTELINEVWLSLVERYVRDVEAASSNLVTSIKKVALGGFFLEVSWIQKKEKTGDPGSVILT